MKWYEQINGLALFNEAYLIFYLIALLVKTHRRIYLRFYDLKTNDHFSLTFFIISHYFLEKIKFPI